MSASLVGSEMCIRDRLIGPTGGIRRDGRNLLRRGRRVLSQGREDARPVSYTHLTLPTICSV
eukprot:6145122-Alexandrium_andersonii.AAC.1